MSVLWLPFVALLNGHYSFLAELTVAMRSEQLAKSLYASAPQSGFVLATFELRGETAKHFTNVSYGRRYSLKNDLITKVASKIM